MTEKKNPTRKDTIWLAVLTVLPVALIWPASELFAESGLIKVLISGLLGGVGTLIGFGVYSVVKNRPDRIKGLAAIGIVVICIGFIVTANYLTKETYETCEVCGFIAVDKDKQECNYCYSLTWEKEESYRDYDNKEEWLTDEQLFWFGLDSLTEKADFYEPVEEQGYKKDKNWKPIISQKDLEKDFKN